MTLIDKAEALLPCPFCGGEAELWNAHDNRPAWIACMGRCAVLISKEHATDAEAIASWNRRAALPARGVGVPTEEDREWIDARADELFRANERIRGSVRPSTIRPQDFRDYFVVNATLERFAALPARGVAVKPLDLDDEQTSRAAKFMAMALWSELHEKAGKGVLPETLPKPAADVLRKLMQEKLAALAPTDAAQAREAALKEAAGMFDPDSNIAQTIIALIGGAQG